MRDYFQWKIGKTFLAINNYFVNEKKSGHPNKSLTFRDFNGLVFLLWSCFFSTIRPLASSDATAYYRPAPGRTDSIPDRDERPRGNGYKSVFTNSWLVCQRNRSWIKGIRQKSPKRVNSFIVCSAFCPGPPNRDPMDSEKRLRAYKSAATMAHHTWRVDKSPGHTHRNRNACLKFLRFIMGNIFACIYGLRRKKMHHVFCVFYLFA